jgi:F-type H+-transporting ATPase subunit b
MCKTFASKLSLLVCLLAVSLPCLSMGFAYGDESAVAGSKAADPPAGDSKSHAAGDDGHGEGEHGPPMSFTADLALWSLVVFALFLFVLKKAAWAPMIEGLDKREAGIRKAIEDAEDNRRKAQALLSEYDQRLKAAERTVQEMVAEARRDAERTSQDLITNAQREVSLIRDRAKEDIRQAKDTALSELFTQVNAQVLTATEHVLGRALQDGDQERLVNQALAEMAR